MVAHRAVHQVDCKDIHACHDAEIEDVDDSTSEDADEGHRRREVHCEGTQRLQRRRHEECWPPGHCMLRSKCMFGRRSKCRRRIDRLPISKAGRRGFGPLYLDCVIQIHIHILA
jgi:hypothetical protein